MTMTNKGSFKTIGKESIVEEFTDGIKIYLESTDDQFIFKEKWFSRFNDKLSFESVSQTRGDGGCQLVLKKVENSTPTAYGIVDRDVLLANPDFQDSLWWEIDDEVFSSSKPYGETVFVLHRWELENYLLHPMALASLVADKKLDSTFSASDIAHLLRDGEDDMVAVTVLSTISTKAGTALAGGDQQFLKEFGDELIKEIQNKLQVQPDVIAAERTKINRFAENEQEPIRRWNKLSRMLDGKRIMHRMYKLLFSDKDKVKLESERGVLAGYIAKHKLIDPALTAWLNEIYISAA